jgi:hypothetical protein
MTNRNPLPSRFVYMEAHEQISLIYDQLRNLFDSSLSFQHYTIDKNMRGMTTISITFSIMTKYDDILKVTYKDEKKILSVHKMTPSISAHLLSNESMIAMTKDFIDVVNRYALKDLFIVDTRKSYSTASELISDLLLRQHGITINLHTGKAEYVVIFHFNERNVKLTLALNDVIENKITLDYYKKIKKTLKGRYGTYTSETSKNVTLTKAYFDAFEHCFYELYLKAEYNIPRKTKDALKVIEMLVI